MVDRVEPPSISGLIWSYPLNGSPSLARAAGRPVWRAPFSSFLSGNEAKPRSSHSDRAGTADGWTPTVAWNPPSNPLPFEMNAGAAPWVALPT